MPKFKIGDIVIVHGDYHDFTDHLDGKVGVIDKVGHGDYKVYIKDAPGYFKSWWIWEENLSHA